MSLLQRIRAFALGLLLASALVIALGSVAAAPTIQHQASHAININTHVTPDRFDNE